MKRMFATAVLSCSAAFGQSFNVDLNATSGAGSGASSSAYKGAAGQAGIWNAVGGTTPVALTNIGGGATAVMFSRTPVNSGTIVNNSSGALSGDDEKLLEDGFQGNTGVSVTYQFSSLSAGTYAVYTYAIDPASPIVSLVNVAGSTSQSDQDVGTVLSGPGYFVGSTHALHVATVPAGGSLNVTVAPPVPGQGVNIAGFQLVQLPAALLRIYVNDNAAGAGLGSSWADAFTHPVTALSTARVAGGQNCEVWVANGFYKPTNTTERFRSFDIPNHLKFYGGFAGTESDLSQRHPGGMLTYLSGDIGDTSIDTDNSYTVVDASLTAADTVIDGFRVHFGYNNDGGVAGGQGGGLLLQGSSATVRNCTFVDNWATSYGAGVYCNAGQPTLVNCLFYRNESFAGSGLHHSGQFPVRLYNCRFMSNNTFHGTVALDDADGYLTNCVFTGNYAAAQGGAVRADGNNSQVWIGNCTIAGNAAGQNVGGVLAIGGADVLIANSILWANTDENSPTTLSEQYAFSGGGSLVTVDETTVQGAAGYNGLDPLFIDGNGADNVWGSFDDNCGLQAGSPCVNHGDNLDVPSDLGDVDGDGITAEPLPLDFDGNDRIRDGVVDRGATEYQPLCDLPGDLNSDNSVDLGDLAMLLGHFGMQSGAGAEDGDVDGDADVDLSDLAALLANFGSSCD